MKTTCIFHSADFDGLFCREIARKFLPDAELIGWDFKDKPLAIPPEGQIYILDLPVDRVFGFDFAKAETAYAVLGDIHAMKAFNERLWWIDHHKSSIETHPTEIKGYRIDGVSACRLAWQWFAEHKPPQGAYWSEGNNKTFDWLANCNLPEKKLFIDRKVNEPLAVRLAGIYDVFEETSPLWEQAKAFQFGLRSRELTPDDWDWLLMAENPKNTAFIYDLRRDGELLQRYQQGIDKGTMGKSFLIDFEGLKFLALNTTRCNSLTFAAKDVPETGHDALLGFYWDGAKWNVSLYHAEHRKDIDLSAIAVKHGGGGHKGACGWNTPKLPFIP